MYNDAGVFDNPFDLFLLINIVPLFISIALLLLKEEGFGSFSCSIAYVIFSFLMRGLCIGMLNIPDAFFYFLLSGGIEYVYMRILLTFLERFRGDTIIYTGVAIVGSVIIIFYFIQILWPYIDNLIPYKMKVPIHIQ